MHEVADGRSRHRRARGFVRPEMKASEYDVGLSGTWGHARNTERAEKARGGRVRFEDGTRLKDSVLRYRGRPPLPPGGGRVLERSWEQRRHTFWRRCTRDT